MPSPKKEPYTGLNFSEQLSTTGENTKPLPLPAHQASNPYVHATQPLHPNPTSYPMLRLHPTHQQGYSENTHGQMSTYNPMPGPVTYPPLLYPSMSSLPVPSREDKKGTTGEKSEYPAYQPHFPSTYGGILCDSMGADYKAALLDTLNELSQTRGVSEQTTSPEDFLEQEDQNHLDMNQVMATHWLNLPNAEEETVQPLHAPLSGSVPPAVQRLRSIVQGIKDLRCANCGINMCLNAEAITELTKKWTTASQPDIALGVRCGNPKCLTMCLGCGKAHKRWAYRCTFLVNNKICYMCWCCDAGRGAALWALACGWESQKSDRIKKLHQTISPTMLLNLSQHPKAYPKGVGYSTDTCPDSPSAPKEASRQSLCLNPDPKEHQMQEAYFKLFNALLFPNRKLQKPNNSVDLLTPNTNHSPLMDLITLIVSHSPLMDTAAEFLSSESFDEMLTHLPLAASILEFICAIKSHPDTARLAYDDRSIYHKKGGDLLSLSFTDNPHQLCLHVKDMGKSVVAMLDTLAVQAKYVQKRYTEMHPFTGIRNDMATQESKMLFLAGTIIGVYDHLNRDRPALQKILTNGTSVASSRKTSRIDIEEWHRENCVLGVPDETMFSTYAYSDKAHAIAQSGAPKGRMRRLVTEMASLRTSLPQGIFIRHAESRLDVIKVLIIGPRGTPYEHGFFEFDLFCGHEYPHKPPVMILKNTGGTSANPNLYEDGRVCLSLLGTWAGEPWYPTKSTILQLVVSIQSMILCEEPYYNEPGRAAHPEKGISDRYNEKARLWTLKIALIPWVEGLAIPNIPANSQEKLPEVDPPETQVQGPCTKLKFHYLSLMGILTASLGTASSNTSMNTTKLPQNSKDKGKATGTYTSREIWDQVINIYIGKHADEISAYWAANLLKMSSGEVRHGRRLLEILRTKGFIKGHGTHTLNALGIKRSGERAENKT